MGWDCGGLIKPRGVLWCSSTPLVQFFIYRYMYILWVELASWMCICNSSSWFIWDVSIANALHWSISSLLLICLANIHVSVFQQVRPWTHRDMDKLRTRGLTFEGNKWCAKLNACLAIALSSIYRSHHLFSWIRYTPQIMQKDSSHGYYRLDWRWITSPLNLVPLCTCCRQDVIHVVWDMRLLLSPWDQILCAGRDWAWLNLMYAQCAYIAACAASWKHPLQS